MSEQKKSIFTKTTKLNQIQGKDGGQVEITNLTLTKDQAYELIQALDENEKSGETYVQLSLFTSNKVNNTDGREFLSTNISVGGYTPQQKGVGGGSSAPRAQSRFVPKAQANREQAVNRADRVKRGIEG